MDEAELEQLETMKKANTYAEGNTKGQFDRMEGLMEAILQLLDKLDRKMDPSGTGYESGFKAGTSSYAIPAIHNRQSGLGEEPPSSQSPSSKDLPPPPTHDSKQCTVIASPGDEFDFAPSEFDKELAVLKCPIFNLLDFNLCEYEMPIDCPSSNSTEPVPMALLGSDSSSIADSSSTPAIEDDYRESTDLIIESQNIVPVPRSNAFIDLFHPLPLITVSERCILNDLTIPDVVFLAGRDFNYCHRDNLFKHGCLQASQFSWFIDSGEFSCHGVKLSNFPNQWAILLAELIIPLIFDPGPSSTIVYHVYLSIGLVDTGQVKGDSYLNMVAEVHQLPLILACCGIGPEFSNIVLDPRDIRANGCLRYVDVGAKNLFSSLICSSILNSFNLFLRAHDLLQVLDSLHCIFIYDPGPHISRHSFLPASHIVAGIMQVWCLIDCSRDFSADCSRDSAAVPKYFLSLIIVIVDPEQVKSDYYLYLLAEIYRILPAQAVHCIGNVFSHLTFGPEDGTSCGCLRLVEVSDVSCARFPSLMMSFIYVFDPGVAKFVWGLNCVNELLYFPDVATTLRIDILPRFYDFMATNWCLIFIDKLMWHTLSVKVQVCVWFCCTYSTSLKATLIVILPGGVASGLELGLLVPAHHFRVRKLDRSGTTIDTGQALKWRDMAEEKPEEEPAITHRVLWDVDLDGQQLGRIIMGPYDQVVPKTVENFRVLRTREKGKSSNGLKLHYKGPPFHHIVSSFTIQDRDIVPQNERGYKSILLQFGFVSGYFFWLCKFWPMKSLDVFQPQQCFLLVGMTKQYQVEMDVCMNMGYLYIGIAPIRWNGLDPPTCITWAALLVNFSNLDLKDKVHFNGGGNVMVMKYWATIKPK